MASVTADLNRYANHHIYSAQQATPLQLFGGAVVALVTGSWVVFVFASQRRKTNLTNAQTKGPTNAQTRKRRRRK